MSEFSDRLKDIEARVYATGFVAQLDGVWLCEELRKAHKLIEELREQVRCLEADRSHPYGY